MKSTEIICQGSDGISLGWRGAAVFWRWDFGLLARLTTLYVELDVSLNVWPPVVACDEFLRFVSTWMASNCGIMVSGNDLCAEFLVNGNVEAIFP